MKVKLGQRVKKLRNSLALTQKQFASRVPGKIDYTYIGKIERGQQYPSLKLLERIGKAFSMPLVYFFEDSRQSKQGIMSYVEVLEWLNDYEKRAEATAEERLKQRKYMMYGYWKAIVVEVTKMKREVKKFMEGTNSLPPLYFYHSAFIMGT